MKLDFIKSPRFWQLFLVGLVAFAEEMSRTSDYWKALAIGITIWLGGSVTVRTIDRIGDKINNKTIQ